LLVKAAAADLRKIGGLGSAPARITAAKHSTDNIEWSSTILGESSVSDRHCMTLLAVSQLTQQLALTSPVTALYALAERFIFNMTDDRLDRMLPSVLGPGKLTATQFADLREEVQRAPQIILLRDQLVKHPNAIGLRAPRRVVRPQNPGDLLNTDLGDL